MFMGVYTRVNKGLKQTEIILDFPDFVPYLKGHEGGRNLVGMARLIADSTISSDWNESGMRGKIHLVEMPLYYTLKCEARLSTDHIGFCAFHFDVKAFLHGGDQTSVLIDSRQDSGLGNGKLSSTGGALQIQRENILEKAKGTNATTFRIILNVKAEVYEQPTPHSTAGAFANKQCHPPFLEQLDFGNSDVQLITCENETIPAHSFILKHASPVFCRMMGAPFMEAATRKILIEDLRPDTVNIMVDYIYYGRISFGSNAQVVDLLYAAEKYEFDLLKTACLERMVASMSEENVTLFLEMTVRVHAGDQVIKQMVTYCLTRMGKLLKRKDFQAFAQANHEIFLGN